MAVGIEQQTHPTADDFLDGVWKRNPVFVQVLGMCPVLAVSNTAMNALAMGLATSFVLLMSNIVVSTIRGVVPQASTNRHFHPGDRDVCHDRRLRDSGDQS